MDAPSYRTRLTDYIASMYGCEPEALWPRWPSDVIFRHGDNRKWFALMMEVKRCKMGLTGESLVDVLNVRMGDPMFAELLAQQPGYRMAYHMQRGSWVSILLDGTVPFEEIVKRVDESYAATAAKPKRPRKKEQTEAEKCF